MADIEDTLQRRGRFRNYTRFEEEIDDQEEQEDSNINPFLVIFFVAVLTISLALFITFSIKSNSKEETEFNLYSIRKRESLYGKYFISFIN